MADPIQWSESFVFNGGQDETQSPQKIAEPKWQDSLNAEPLFDGVRARKGSVAQNSPLGTSAKSYELGATNSGEFQSTNGRFISQSFTTTGAIAAVRLALRPLYVGTPPAVVASTQPDSVANLVAWYKPETLTGRDGAEFTGTWTDSSGNARHLTAPDTSSYPILREDAFKGFAALEAQGSATQMVSAITAALTGAFTVYVLTKRTVASDQNVAIGDSGAGAMLVPRDNSSSQDATIDFGSGPQIAGSGILTDRKDYSLAIFRRDGSNDLFYNDERLPFTGTTGISGTFTFSTLFKSGGLGYSSAAGFQIVEVAIYSASHTGATQEGIYNYFADKYELAKDDDLAVAIYTNSGSTPSRPVATGSHFNHFSPIRLASLATTANWVNFYAQSAIALSATTQYHIVARVFNPNAPATTFNIWLTGVTAAGTAEVMSRSLAGSSWANFSDEANYRVFSEGGPITAIADFRNSTTLAQRHIVFSGGLLYENDGSGELVDLAPTSLAASMSASNLVLPSWDVGQDRFLITDGISAISRKLYDASGVQYENEGISPPTATPGIAAAAGGSLADGTWEVDYYYWNNDIGIRSNSRYLGVSALSQTLGAGNNTIALTSLPAAVARTGDRATHLRIELKAPGSTVFRLATNVTVTLGTTSVNITSATLGDPTSYDHAVPPQHKIKLVAENRQWIAGIAGFPFRVMFSAIVGRSAFYESFPEDQFRDFGRGDNGDYVTALAFVPPRSLVVGMKRSIWAIDVFNPGNSAQFRIANGVGISGHRALSVIGGRMYFWSDSELHRGPFVWSGEGEPQPIIGLDDTIKALNISRFGVISCSHLAPGDNRFQWLSVVSTSGSTWHDRVIGYDYALNAWFIYEYPFDIGVIGLIDSPSTTASVFLGGSDGVERKGDTTDADEGAAIRARVTMKDMDFGSKSVFKRSLFADVTVLGSATGSVTLFMDCDLRDGTSAVLRTEIGDDSGAFILDTSVLGTGVFGVAAASIDIDARYSMRCRGKLLTPRLEGRAPWHVKTVAFGVQPTRKK